MKYKCIQDFPIEIYDEYGMLTGEYRNIKAGSIFHRDDYADYIGGEVHLDSENEWIEISNETLKECFEELSDV